VQELFLSYNLEQFTFIFFQICYWHDDVIMDNDRMHWMLQNVRSLSIFYSKKGRLEHYEYLDNLFHNIFPVCFSSIHYHFCDGSLSSNLCDKLNLSFLLKGIQGG